MAKKWYPVIDILTCLECGTCVAKCIYGVYDKNKAPVPMVVNPDNCIDNCHGCGNLCPVGTDGVLDEVMDIRKPVLEIAGYQVLYQKQEITTACCCGGSCKTC